jgi:putative phage-type endonuclease
VSKRFEFIKAPQRSPEWFALRKDAITATDIAVISGLSPYKTPFRLFAEKSGKVMEQAAGTAADRGRLLEDAVAKYYEQERKVKLRQSNGIVRLKAHPWAMASLDRTIVGEPDGIVEIKTSTSRAWDLQPIPPLVTAQVERLLGRIELAGPTPDHQRAVEHFAESIRRSSALLTKPSPAVQQAAREIMLDAHLGTAEAIALGTWQQKSRVIPKWMARAEAVVAECTGDKSVQQTLELQLCSGALAVAAGSADSTEPLPWV